jgi:hypothetical protein
MPGARRPVWPRRFQPGHGARLRGGSLIATTSSQEKASTFQRFESMRTRTRSSTKNPAEDTDKEFNKEPSNLFGKDFLTSPDEAALTPRNQGTEVPLRNKKV